MGEHEKETAFLKRIILYEDSDERRELEKRIAQVQHDERCVRRVALVTTLLPVLAIAIFAYGTILRENFPYDGSELVFRLVCELGLASLICLAGLAGLLRVYRMKLNRLREDGRQLVTKLLVSHLGKPHIAARPDGHDAPNVRGAFAGAAEVSGYSGSLISVDSAD
jgi:hypothetical protein